jgi:hypothetical protein
MDRRLHYGLTAVLGFADAKLIASEWIEIPSGEIRDEMGAEFQPQGLVSPSRRRNRLA